MDWKAYEKLIFSEFQQRYLDCEIKHNAFIEGKLSGISRQIDVLIEATIGSKKFITVLDAKMYNKAIDVKGVEEFLSMVSDVGAHRGLMVTTVGYTSAALQRAYNDPAEIELDILTLDEFLELQAPFGLPYSNGRGVMLTAPFGWAIDGTKRDGVVATLYQRGKTLESAASTYEFAYVNFWHKDVPNSSSTLEELLALQMKNLLNEDPNIEVTYQNSPDNIKFLSRIRLAKRSNHPAFEYTGFIEFDSFIFFVVLFTLPQTANRNYRKLLELMTWARPFLIQN